MQVQGRVIAVGSRSCEVFVEGQGTLRCTLRGSLFKGGEAGGAGRKADGRLSGGRRETGRARDSRHGGGQRAGKREIAAERPVAVGDRVLLSLTGSTSGRAVDGVVEEVRRRTSLLTRASPDDRTGRVHVLAANIDRLVVVAALANPPLRPGLVDRFLVAAARADLPPVVVLNKVDLEGTPDDDGVPLTRALLAPYRTAGLEVLETSCVTGEGVDALRARLASGVSLIIGHSGVGKTSLVNAAVPGLSLAVGDVTEYHGRGRHTTTSARLVPLPGLGSWLVDSPGLREFALDDVGPADLARLFPGFGQLPDSCRFSDCLHRSEPGCAVLGAIERGELTRERHDTYLRVLDESEAAPRW
jgi:ribosome biogenesis GTPase / thiamine phosphate phosphatase